MKLLEVLQSVAEKSQKRFASNFQEILLNASKDIDDELFIVHEFLDRPYVAITADIKVVISIVSHLGKDCQVIKMVLLNHYLINPTWYNDYGRR